MRNVKRALLVVLVLTFGAGEAIAKYEYSEGYSNVYFFGDSLTDRGNVWLLTGTQIPPTADYFEGRFSNGPMWCEGFAESLGADAEPSMAGGDNYAYGGARTSYHPSGLPIGVVDQIQMYLSGPGVGGADPHALYIVWAGPNDVQDGIAMMDTPKAARDLVVAGAENVADYVQQLAAAGAVHILVPNSPNLGLTPRWSERDPDAPGTVDFATSLSQLFNDTLDAELDALEFPVRRFNAYVLFELAVRFPGLLGFSNSTDRCYTGDDITWTGGGEVCSNPDEYVWWDGVHPTAAMHRIIARAARLSITFHHRRGRMQGKSH